MQQTAADAILSRRAEAQREAVQRSRVLVGDELLHARRPRPVASAWSTRPGEVTIVYVVSKESAGQRDLNTPGVKDQIRQGLRTRREQLLRTAHLAEARTERTWLCSFSQA